MKLAFTLTASKLLAFLITILGFIYAMVFKDAGVLISLSTMATGLMGFKTGAGTIERLKQPSSENG